MGRGTGALGACGTFAQILVFLVNTVLFAGSVLLIAGSAFLLKQDHSIVQFIDVNNPNQVAYIGICLGSVTAFITFFGCAGSCSQSKKIIKLYLVMLVILFILFLTIIILGATYRKNFGANLTNGMRRSLQNIENHPHTNETEKLKSYWDNMQNQIKCCGQTGWQDWEFTPDIDQVSHIDDQDHEGRNIPESDSNKTTTDIPRHNQEGGIRRKREAKDLPPTSLPQQATNQPDYISQEALDRLPDSCFSNDTKTFDQLHQHGCRDKAKDELQFYIMLVLIASGSVAVVLVFSICISCWLLKSVKRAQAYNCY